MNSIITYIKKHHKKFVFALAVNFLFAIVFNIFFYCRFHTNDDVFMEMIASGAFGKPDYHLIYINAIFGFILEILYTIKHSIPWFGLLQIILSILCFSTIMYVFMNRESKIMKALIIVFLFFASYEVYTKVQFTKTAAYLATAGYLLIAHSFDSNDIRKKQILGILLLTASFMMRTGMFFGCSIVGACCLLPRLFEGFKNKDFRIIKNIAIVAFISLLSIGFTYFIDGLCYTSEGWRYYKLFNTYTTQFEDINFPSYETYQDEFNKLGIDVEDYKLYIAIDHNDPELFDIDKMEKVKQLEPYKKIDSNELVMFVLRGYYTIFRQKTLCTFALFTVVLLLYYFIACKIDFNSFVSIMCTGVGAVISFFYTYVMHGWFDRTTISIMFTIIATIMYLMQERNNKKKYFAYVLIPVMLFVCIYAWNDYFKWNMQKWKNDCIRNLEIVDEVWKDQDHLYLSRTSLPLWKRYYTPYDEMHLGVMSNFSPLGDWMTNTPLFVETLSRYGVTNPYRDMVNNDKVYFISKNDDIELVEIYIKKHYYSNLELQLIKVMGDYKVYSLIGSND